MARSPNASWKGGAAEPTEAGVDRLRLSALRSARAALRRYPVAGRCVEAEDLAQEALLRWLKRSRGRPVSRTTARTGEADQWLRAAVHLLASNASRSPWVRRRTPAEFAELAGSASDGEPRIEAEEQVRCLVALLPPFERSEVLSYLAVESGTATARRRQDGCGRMRRFRLMRSLRGRWVEHGPMIDA